MVLLREEKRRCSHQQCFVRLSNRQIKNKKQIGKYQIKQCELRQTLISTQKLNNTESKQPAFLRIAMLLLCLSHEYGMLLMLLLYCFFDKKNQQWSGIVTSSKLKFHPK